MNSGYGMDPCDYDPDGNCFNFWPDHDFRGFHDYHEGFAKDSLTNQTCGVIKGMVTRLYMLMPHDLNHVMHLHVRRGIIL